MNVILGDGKAGYEEGHCDHIFHCRLLSTLAPRTAIVVAGIGSGRHFGILTRESLIDVEM